MRPSLVAAIAALSCVTPATEAQEAIAAARALTLIVGPLLTAERDEHASPLRYDGAGPFMQASYVYRTERVALAVRLGGAIGTLRSAMTGADDLPRQELTRGWIDVEYAHVLGTPRARTRWLLGGGLAQRATLLRHLTVPADANSVGYALYSASIGPLFGIERAIGRLGRLRAQLAVPVLALIGRPYGGLYNKLTLIPDALRLRLATVKAFQAVDVTAAHAVEVGGSTDLVLSYRLVVERYRDAEPFGSASQAMSLGLALRLGRDR